MQQTRRRHLSHSQLTLILPGVAMTTWGRRASALACCCMSSPPMTTHSCSAGTESCQMHQRSQQRLLLCSSGWLAQLTALAHRHVCLSIIP